VVVLKPAGLPSVPGRAIDLHDCAASRVSRVHADARVVHRLDMATSGLILFARGAEAQRRLNAAFAARAVEKTYIAIVDGLLDADAGAIELPLSADWPRRPLQKIDPVGGKPSLTRFRVVERDTRHRTTRLELRPHTGRAHQLRVHLLAIGHPILGDALYAPASVAAASVRLMLHASGLCFPHPESGRAVSVENRAPF
jgi:tRNA pseudouridine32 synthase/23S rRNA pseudouridine746 synthase